MFAEPADVRTERRRKLDARRSAADDDIVLVESMPFSNISVKMMLQLFDFFGRLYTVGICVQPLYIKVRRNRPECQDTTLVGVLFARLGGTQDSRWLCPVAEL